MMIDESTLIVDSREKWTQSEDKEVHMRKAITRMGLAYEVRKLDVGDYTFDNSSIVVDRKSGLNEVATNLTNKSDSSRFWREVRRAHEQGIKLVVLIESPPRIKTIADVASWKSAYTKVTGRTLIREMVRLEHAYGVVWKFCTKRNTVKTILEILDTEDKDGT